jgi:MerR family copper efflux transcriptional regulator
MYPFAGLLRQLLRSPSFSLTVILMLSLGLDATALMFPFDSGTDSRVHTPMVTNATHHSGGLAKATGVSPDTIRHYEGIGVLPKAVRMASGYRVYPASAVNRVLVVQRALGIGFTLAELADIFKSRDAGGTPCRRVFELAKDKLAGIEADITALKQARRQVIKILADWESRMNKSGRGQKAHLLQSLTDAVKNNRRLILRRKR